MTPAKLVPGFQLAARAAVGAAAAVVLLVSLVPKLIRTREVEGTDPGEACAPKEPSPRDATAPADVSPRTHHHCADGSRTV